MDTRHIERKPAHRPSFTKRYTAADVALIARVDAAHEDLSGPAVRHLFKRGMEFGDEKFELTYFARRLAVHFQNIFDL